MAIPPRETIFMVTLFSPTQRAGETWWDMWTRRHFAVLHR